MNSAGKRKSGWRGESTAAGIMLFTKNITTFRRHVRKTELREVNTFRNIQGYIVVPVLSFKNAFQPAL
jgi:hypothetical protein